ncbi:BMC domain-containing protein [Phycisphaerales bacterium AB-hyl4]|uniref:BMC domain-containing protein n=1 Tax=Natronomicrosphaera hydrolytica TaxID=3242702 RepID=A0ABV4U6S2_9BACT
MSSNAPLPPPAVSEPPPCPRTMAVLEVAGFTAAVAVLDAAQKAAHVRLLQAELNDLLGLVIKLVGDRASLDAAIDAAHAQAAIMHTRVLARVLDGLPETAWPAIWSLPEFNPLIAQDVVLLPQEISPAMTNASIPALGFIETQGFTAVFEAIDTACKAADVQVVAKEKLGGGYVTIVIQGDVAAVKAAIDAGSAKVESLGKLIAAHVIARPSDAVMSLLPKG